MEVFFILIISYLIIPIKNIIIYQCSRYEGMPDQCLNKWVDAYGNTRMDLWHCPTNQFCQTLLTNGNENSIGVCTFYYRKLYDGDSCDYNSQCSSFQCSGGKCQGFYEGELCRPGNYQCANDLVCKLEEVIYPYGELKEVYRCANLSQIYEPCKNDNECDVKLVCSENQIYDIMNNLNEGNISNINELREKINETEYIFAKNNESNKICVEAASFENGMPTSNAMACKSGDIISVEIFPNYTENICVSKKEIIQDCNEEKTCVIKIDLGKFGEIEFKQSCMFSVRGNLFCPLEQREVAWKNYLSTYNHYYKALSMNTTDRNKDVRIPAYKNTFNLLELSQSFWYYTEWQNSIEADSCTREFFFLRSKGNLLSYSIFSLLIYFFYL